VSLKRFQVGQQSRRMASQRWPARRKRLTRTREFYWSPTVTCTAACHTRRYMPRTDVAYGKYMRVKRPRRRSNATAEVPAEDACSAPLVEASRGTNTRSGDLHRAAAMSRWGRHTRLSPPPRRRRVRSQPSRIQTTSSVKGAHRAPAQRNRMGRIGGSGTGLRAQQWRGVARGGVNACSACPREIFRAAIVDGAHAIVMAHNHPSGDASPSSEDVEITKCVKKAGALLGIQLLDHVIVTAGGELYSFEADQQF
jgi:hypothetical protein